MPNVQPSFLIVIFNYVTYMNEWVGMGIHRDIEFPGAGVRVIRSYQKPNSGHPEEQ